MKSNPNTRAPGRSTASEGVSRTGLSVIELLVVMAIMITLIALLVPRIRLVTKSTRVDEAQRIINSAISTARQRALIDGRAAVMFERGKKSNQLGQYFVAVNPVKIRDVKPQGPVTAYFKPGRNGTYVIV